MTDARLQPVVEAISDGEPVDWESVRRRFTDLAGVGYCTHLETVSKIGRLGQHRDAPHQDLRESTWVSILLTFAGLQIALGIVASFAYRDYSFLNALRLLTVLSFAGMGIVLRQSRYNLRARDLGAVFVLCAFGFSRNPYSVLFDSWFSGFPALAVFRSGVAVDAWAPYFFWQFARRFPTTARFTLVDRTALVLANIAGVVGTVLFVVSVWAAVAPTLPGIASSFAVNQPGQLYYSATIFALTLPALPIILIRARSAPADERARVRLFAVALAAGIAPTYLEVILEALLPAYSAFLGSSIAARNVIVTSVILPFLALPFFTGYSILVHRLLDVRMFIRESVRYLLAKWTLVVVTLMPFGLLASHVYAHRNDSVVSVVSDRRGVALVGLVAAGSVLLAGRGFLLRMLDRWFDRRGTDRTIVLARSGDALRLVRTRSELVASVAEATESALNAPVCVYFFDSRRNAYVPFGRGGLALPGQSALATVMTQEPTLSALGTEGEHSIARFLPSAERLWLAETNACMLAPIRSIGVERPSGVIAFGARHDAIGYSPEDERFVTALASAAGIALENLRLKSEALGEEGADKFGMLCVRCHAVTDSVEGRLSCACGGELQAAAVPRRINNKFQVEALLGAGGMGVAYLACDIALNRLVAIKTLPSISADTMARLGREARTMAALSHPNLATILGHESWRGTPILVCEYLPGGTLQQRLTRGPLEADKALTLGLTLLDALEYMHGQGVLHRDIKPSNIAFTSDNVPKLLDFGLAGLLERDESSTGEELTAQSLLHTRLAGTVAYLPPQAFQGGAPTIRFDLWALTVVLFEAIFGQHPFAAGTDTAHNICRGRFVAAIEDRSDVPAAVSTCLRRGLSPSVHRQFDSTSTMREALMATRIAVQS